MQNAFQTRRGAPRAALLGACLALLAGCNFTGEATRLWEHREADVRHPYRSQNAEELHRLLDQVGYERNGPGRSLDSLAQAPLLERLHYLATFPPYLFFLSARAEREMASPDPANEALVGRGVLSREAGAEEAGRLLASASAKDQLRGLEGIGADDLERHGQRLRALLSSGDPGVRGRAARVAGRLAYAPAAPELVRMAREDPEENNRLTALEALAETGAAEAADLARERARSGRSPFVRAKACEILGRHHRDARSVAALVDRLRADREMLVRDEAAVALRRLTRLAIPPSAYDRPDAVDAAVIERLRDWCRRNRIEVLF